MDQEEFSRVSRQVWDTVSRGWEDQREYVWQWYRPVAQWLVEQLAPAPGQTLLELAAGVGDTGFIVARLVGDSGRLISTDFAPSMVEAARRRGRELGLDNVVYGVLDAEKMDLPDNYVDGVLCRFGYMLMGDPARALAETRRLLKDGGRLSFAVFDEAEANPWAAVPAKVLVQQGIMPPPPEGSPGIFALGDRTQVEGLVRQAGFSKCRIESVAVEFRFADMDDYWKFLTDLAGALAHFIAQLGAVQRARLREVMEAALEPFRTEEGYVLSGMSLCVVAE